ncbi:MAG: ABC transporter ATP-binding protein [Acetobacteraceae bacterium]
MSSKCQIRHTGGLAAPLLAVDELSTWFDVRSERLLAIDRVSFTVNRGECVAVVGESGSGKSVTALSIMRLLPVPPAAVTARGLRFAGTELLALSEDAMRRLRGRGMAMIFQEPMTSLHPILRVRRQITETLDPGRPRPEITERALELMRLVRISDPERRLSEYPHQLSGGMRQRVMIAMALAGAPALLIADEPTTALDVTIQAQILDLLRDLRQQLGMALLLITHDMGVVAENADRVLVMYAGRIVEQAGVMELFDRPLHPYTVGLMASIPRLDQDPPGGQQRLLEMPGVMPSLAERPAGCAFAPRCRYVVERCRRESPPLLERLPGHLSACWEWHRLAEEER